MGLLRHGVSYETARPVLDVTGWLEDNCEGAWTVEVQEDYSLGAKVKILFETTKDKQSFIRDFA